MWSSDRRGAIIIWMPYQLSTTAAKDMNIRSPMPRNCGSCVSSRLVMASCTVAIGSYPNCGSIAAPPPRLQRLGLPPGVQALRRQAEQILRVREAPLPLVELRVHLLGLRVALPLVRHEQLFHGGQDRLIRLFRDAEA